MIKYRVYFTNMGYYSQDEFDTPKDAIEYGKKVCFEFCVDEHTAEEGKVTTRRVCSWSPIGGLRSPIGGPFKIQLASGNQ